MTPAQRKLAIFTFSCLLLAAVLLLIGEQLGD